MSTATAPCSPSLLPGPPANVRHVRRNHFCRPDAVSNANSVLRWQGALRRRVSLITSTIGWTPTAVTSGRVALFYQTQDGELSGVWDQETRSWVPLPGSQNRLIRKAIRVARKQVAPELLSLPISAPEDAI